MKKQLGSQTSLLMTSMDCKTFILLRDGNGLHKNGQTINHDFSIGTHLVTLRVTDLHGDWSEDALTITVHESVTTVSITEPASGTIEGKITVRATAENLSGPLSFWLVGSDSYWLGASESPYKVSFHTKDYPAGDYLITANDSLGKELDSVNVTIPSKGGGGDDGGGSGGGPDCTAKPNHPKCR